MNGVTTLILKLSGMLILWIVCVGLVAEYVINREVNIIVQIISIMGSLLLTIGALNYMVKIIIKFINKIND
jgi:hypothetical protein